MGMKSETIDASDSVRVSAGQASAVKIPIVSGESRYQVALEAAEQGTFVISITSPRPLRAHLGDVMVANENLYWRLFNRRVYAAAVVPAAGGRQILSLEVGERPRHPDHVDHASPSRNREHVMAELARRIPDELAIEVRLVKGVAAPAVGLRFTPTQFRRDGVTFQEVMVRPLAPVLQLPSTHTPAAASPADVGLDLRSGIMPKAGLEKTREQDARAGLRRFFVPVAEASAEPAPLRSEGKDNRVEPSHEVCKEVTLTIEGTGGEITLPMPAFESTGRLAPRREYRDITWPSEAELRRSVPDPVLPAEYAHFGQLYDASWRMFLELVRSPEPESGAINPYVATGSGFGLYQFVWDSSFTAICMAYAWRSLSVHVNLDNLYSRQFDGGYIHREHWWADGLPHLYEPDFSPNPPIMSVAEWQLARLSGDLLRVKRAYPALKAHHQWLWHNRRLADGTFWTTGLANGLDNSPSLGDGYPCLSAQMAHDAEILMGFARTLGYEKDVAEFQRQHEQIAAAVNERLWDAKVGIYATSLAKGGHNPNKVATAFWPMWAGITPAERVAQLAGHLKDPKSFWRHHPIPSLAADSPHFRPAGDYWLGSTWAPTNYAAIKGFNRAGRHDLAVETTIRHLQCMYDVLQQTGKIWENYSSESSVRGSWSGSPYCWSALGPVALLLEVLIGIEPDALARTIRWTVPSVRGIGVRNYPLGPATVSVVYGANPDEIEVQTDLPFTLVLEGKTPVTKKCPAGRSAIRHLSV